MLTLQKPVQILKKNQYKSHINFRKSHQISQNLDELLKNYKAKHTRGVCFAPPSLIRLKQVKRLKAQKARVQKSGKKTKRPSLFQIAYKKKLWHAPQTQSKASNWREPENPKLLQGSKLPCFTVCKTCVCYFLSNFYFSPNDSPSKTMKNVFYFI